MCHLQKSISILISTPRHPPSLFRSQSLPRLSSRVFLAALACFAVALLAFALAAIPLSGPLPEAPCNAISDNPEGLPGPPLGPPPGSPCNAISDPPGGPPGPTLGVSVAPGPPPHGYWWGDSTTPPRSDAGFGPAAVAWLKKMPGAWWGTRSAECDGHVWPLIVLTGAAVAWALYAFFLLPGDLEEPLPFLPHLNAHRLPPFTAGGTRSLERPPGGMSNNDVLEFVYYRQQRERFRASRASAAAVASLQRLHSPPSVLTPTASGSWRSSGSNSGAHRIDYRGVYTAIVAEQERTREKGLAMRRASAEAAATFARAATFAAVSAARASHAPEGLPHMSRSASAPFPSRASGSFPMPAVAESALGPTMRHGGAESPGGRISMDGNWVAGVPGTGTWSAAFFPSSSAAAAAAARSAVDAGAADAVAAAPTPSSAISDPGAGRSMGLPVTQAPSGQFASPRQA